MKAKFKQPDSLLIQLLGACREDAARLRKTHVEHRKNMEIKGQARIAAMKESLPENITGLLEKAGKAYCNHPNWPDSGISRRQSIVSAPPNPLKEQAKELVA